MKCELDEGEHKWSWYFFKKVLPRGDGPDIDRSEIALDVIKKVGWEKVAPEWIANTERVYPHYIRLIRREQLVQKGEYEKTVKAARLRHDGLSLTEKRLMPKGEYEDLVAAGWHESRYPLEKRKELFAEFARTVGYTRFPKLSVLDERNNLSVPLFESELPLMTEFDDLSVNEMDRVMRLVRTFPNIRLKHLTRDQRQLLLRAGAFEWFSRELEAVQSGAR